MSEVLEDYKKRKLDWKLRFSAEAPLSYVKRQVDLSNEILFCVEIPWPLLHLWNNLRQNTSGKNVNFVDFLNSTVTDAWFVVKSERIEELLQKQSAAIKVAFGGKKGRKRALLDDKVYKLSVKRGETESIDHYKSEASKSNDELEEYKRKLSDFEQEKNKLLEEMIKEKDQMEQEISDLKFINQELADYVETLEKRDSLNCQGRKIHEVGTKQKGRRLRVLKNKAQCALWFCKSFGLEISQIKLKDEEGCNSTFDYTADHGDSNMSENERIEQILFLLDKFCVGDALYHEVSILSDDLPKSYLVKQLRAEGVSARLSARLDFTSTLRDHVKELLAQQPDLSDSVVQVKLSGDGARMTRSTNFMMFSFALLQQGNVMSSKSNRTVAIINGKEDYQTLKTALPDFFDEVNSLIETGSLLVDGNEVKLEFFLGGDYKFLLMIMGLNSATADYACLWCEIRKQFRWDTSKDLLFCHEWKLSSEVHFIFSSIWLEQSSSLR